MHLATCSLLFKLCDFESLPCIQYNQNSILWKSLTEFHILLFKTTQNSMPIDEKYMAKMTNLELTTLPLFDSHWEVSSYTRLFSSESRIYFYRITIWLLGVRPLLRFWLKALSGKNWRFDNGMRLFRTGIWMLFKHEAIRAAVQKQTWSDVPQFPYESTSTHWRCINSATYYYKPLVKL